MFRCLFWINIWNLKTKKAPMVSPRMPLFWIVPLRHQQDLRSLIQPFKLSLDQQEFCFNRRGIMGSVIAGSGSIVVLHSLKIPPPSIRSSVTTFDYTESSEVSGVIRICFINTYVEHCCFSLLFIKVCLVCFFHSNGQLEYHQP